MITITIFINGNPILSRSATRTNEFRNGEAEYTLDDGLKVAHNPKKGAVELAKKMLDCIDKDFVTRQEEVKE